MLKFLKSLNFGKVFGIKIKVILEHIKTTRLGFLTNKC